MGRRWEREKVWFVEANRAKVFTGVVRGMHSFRNMERRRKVGSWSLDLNLKRQEVQH